MICTNSYAVEKQSTNIISETNLNKMQYSKSINKIITSTSPNNYEPREILYIDEWDKNEYILKLNALQFKKYNFDKCTKPINIKDEYYKKQNLKFKKQMSQIYSSIDNISLQFCTKFNINENEDFEYYIRLLYNLLKGSDLFNIDVNNGLYNDSKFLKCYNYADQYDIEFTFDVWIGNICEIMKNSKIVKYFERDDEINEFRLGLQKNIKNKEKRTKIWNELMIFIDLPQDEDESD